MANRRDDRRIPLDTFCNEYIRDRHYRGLITNVSERGLHVQRLARLDQRPTRLVQLEFELPGTGELIWGLGETCFDEMELASLGPTAEERPAALHSSGIRMVTLAQKHARLMRDYVVELRRKRVARAIEEAAALAYA